MSVHVQCDRCLVVTGGYFLNAKLTVSRGVFASINSKIHPGSYGKFWNEDWHLCESCANDLKRWTTAVRP